jgi:hypothetical protein
MMKSLATKAMFAAGAATVATSAVSAPAEAFVVEVGGHQWNITTKTGTLTDLKDELIQQPWFTGDLDLSTADNDFSLAQEFANKLGGELDFPNTVGTQGPFFFFGTNTPSNLDNNVNNERFDVGFATYQFNDALLLTGFNGGIPCPPDAPPVVCEGDDFGPGNPFDNEGTWAVATKVPTPALLPGLIGMGVAALRKRNGDTNEAEA